MPLYFAGDEILSSADMLWRASYAAHVVIIARARKSPGRQLGHIRCAHITRTSPIFHCITIGLGIEYIVAASPYVRRKEKHTIVYMKIVSLCKRDNTACYSMTFNVAFDFNESS